MKMYTIVFISILLLGSPDAQAETLILATGEWPPYTSEHLEDYGFITAIVSEVVTEMGVETEYMFYPWRRCFDSVKKGKIWAAFPYAYTEERAKDVLFSEELGWACAKFFYYKDKKGVTYKTLEDLRPYRIGGLIGYFYEETFKEAGLQVDYTTDEITAAKMLMAGRIDFMPSDELVWRYIIKQHFPEELHHFDTLEKPLETSGLYLIVSKSYPRSEEFLKQFNEALKTFKTTDRYMAILQKYGVQEQPTVKSPKARQTP